MFNLLVLLGVVGSQFFMLSNPTNGDEFWVFTWLMLVAVSSFIFASNRRVDTSGIAVVLITVLFSVLCHRLDPRAPIFLHVFFNVLLGCFAIKIIAERCTLSPRKIGDVLVRVWIIIHVVLILQALDLIWNDYELSGFYTMPWVMGCAACLSIPFIRKTKAIHSLILVLPIVLSHSSICIATALVMWHQPKLRLKYILLAVFAILALIFVFDRGIDTTRFVVIENTFPHFHNRLIGDGIGIWAHKAFVMNNGADPYYWRWAHNEFYQMFCEVGIVGLLAVVGCLINLFKMISQEQRYYLFAIIALSMFHPIFHKPRLIPFLIVLLALFHRREQDDC